MSEVIMRERQLNIRLSEEESRRVDFVAEHYGLNVAALLRMLVKREADALAARPSVYAPRPGDPPAPPMSAEHREGLRRIKPAKNSPSTILDPVQRFEQVARDKKVERDAKKSPKK